MPREAGEQAERCNSPMRAELEQKFGEVCRALEEAGAPEQTMLRLRRLGSRMICECFSEDKQEKELSQEERVGLVRRRIAEVLATKDSRIGAAHLIEMSLSECSLNILTQIAMELGVVPCVHRQNYRHCLAMLAVLAEKVGTEDRTSLSELTKRTGYSPKTTCSILRQLKSRCSQGVGAWHVDGSGKLGWRLRKLSEFDVSK